ncbi:aspartate aminotransferase [Enterococcus sp. DIV0724b]|uniref:pyridoxal phosphate-dependent aminotransferase n=1 Tax=Enterococcus sp. DIV0724b TaxID=2774694 RepID=UPI003D2FEE26
MNGKYTHKTFSNYDMVKQLGDSKKSIFLAGGTSEKIEVSEYNDLELFDLFNYYEDTKGNFNLRRAYQKKCISNQFLNIDNVLVTSGATAAIYMTLKTFVKNGESIGLFYPCWSLYSSICNQLDIKIKKCSLDVEKKLRFDVRDVEQIFNSNIKAILLANPSNPTGHFLEEDSIKKLIELSNKKNVLLIIDETYFGLSEKDDESFLDYVENLNNIIIIRSLSKYYRSPGIRIGFAITSVDKVNKLHETARNMYLGPSSLSQKIGLELIKRIDSNWHLEICKKNLEKLVALEKEMPNLKLIYPDIFFFCCFQIIDSKGMNISTEKIFENTKIILRDAEDFNLKGFQRINLCVDEETMDIIVNRIKIFKEDICIIK